MTDQLFLIAHKVRGQPAFDIAEHMTCPKCNATDDHCTQCDGVGHWWIIPTSGHRAFPWWSCELYDVFTEHELRDYGGCRYKSIESAAGSMPPGLRDHYTTIAEAAIDLTKVLGLIHAPLARPTIKRRL